MSPKEQYSQRLAERNTHLARFDMLDARIGGIRLGLGAAFLIIAWLCFGPLSIPRGWLGVPILGFIAMLVYHQRVRSLRTQAQRAVQFYRAGLDRLSDQWGGKGTTGARFDDRHHIYGDDLDLFGKDSLYELLCAARTQMGENILAEWLLAPADLEVIRARHASISDLRARFAFREAMAIDGESLKIDLHPETLDAWARAPNRLDRMWIRLSAPLIAGLAMAAVAVWAAWETLFPLIAVIMIEIAIMFFLRKPIHAAITTVESAFEDLKGLAVLLNRIEAERFDAAPLHVLQRKLSSHSLGASAALSKLATIVNFVESRRNPILAPLMLLLMYPLQTALAAERWRSAHGSDIRSWLDVLGEIEALISLGQYAYEQCDDSFPQFLEGPPAFEARGLGHPLIPAAVRVRNDVGISAETRVLLVSGSNMSGKSTLLRTIGINTVLAMAGAPVRAKSLQLTPLQIGASIRINDSLHEGSSRFYAEITRLRQLFEPTRLPLLFLLDELLQGTNSADRRIGAQGLLRALIKKGAIGLISTHDLALTDIAGLEPGAIKNVHFQDELVDGKLKFDFHLRDGVVTKNNGIELMRSIGLDV
ncbi:MAG: mismatch repair protein [Pseudomonadota bacterium]|nr:mismatch repair protein [Pseudomonadota bacterium]